MKETIAKINKTKSVPSEDKQNWQLWDSLKKKKKNVQINKIINEKGEIIQDNEEYKGS